MLCKLTNNTLITATKKLIVQENELTVKILEYLQEIADRKLFAQMGYSSLYKFCMQELGDTPAKANMRVRCVKVAREFPIVKDQIASGSLNTSQVNLLGGAFKDKALGKKERAKLVKDVSNKSCNETRAIIAKVTKKERSELVRLPERVLAKMDKLGIDQTRLELIEELLDSELQKRASEKAKRAERGSMKQRHIPRSVKEEVYQRAGGRCEYKSSSGKRCTCKSNLQFDHVRPVALGGASTVENLGLMCFAHNQLRAQNVGLKTERSAKRRPSNPRPHKIKKLNVQLNEGLQTQGRTR